MRAILVRFVFLLPFISSFVAAQDSTLYYLADVQAAVSTSTVPLWVRANQNGSVPDNKSFILGRFGIYEVYNKSNPRFFQWSGGVEAIANAGQSSSVFLSDFYVAGKAGPVELSIGQRKEFTGLVDSLLSSGSVAVSQNFRPFPKIQISTPQFTNIIPGNDFVAFKFSYSDGLLGPSNIGYGNVSEIPKTYLHQKSLYLRLGGAHNKLNLYAGFNHQAMWGGESKIFGGGLKTWPAYKYVIFGKPWEASRVGNHFGTVDLAAEWKDKNWSIFAYRQNIYEDGSLSELSNILDGLNGLRFKRNKPENSATLFTVNTILIEYLYTESQGGAVFDYDAGIFGSDNYFNHYVYKQGWSYRGRSLGTPLIGPKELNRSDLPSLPSSYTNNNRISAVHLGMLASWKEMMFTIKTTLSNNLGTYSTPFSPSAKQANLYIKAEKPVSARNKSILSLSLAADLGELYPTSTALIIGWKNTGFLK
jgi:hypothetical protein